VTSGSAAEHGQWSLLSVIRAARRRMRRRRLAMLTVALACGGTVTGALLVHSSGGPGAGSPSSATAARTAQPETVLPPMVPLRDWRAFAGDVNPDPGLAFASPLVEFALSPGGTPGYDENLSSGLRGVEGPRPSPTVLVTRNGGRSFSPSLEVSGGFWGLDFIDHKHGWAVGVRGLYRTADGGRSWQPAGEPSSPLVRVAFATNDSGFGLTVPGRLVATRDGGRTWHAAGWAGAGAALCSLGPRSAIVATTTGSMWRVSPTGEERIAPGYEQIVQLAGWWPNLSCSAQHIVESAQAFCEAACAGELVMNVRQSTNGGRSWRGVVQQRTFNVGAGFSPTALGPIWIAVAAGPRRLCLIGTDRWVTIRCDSSHNAAVPRLRRGVLPDVRSAYFESARTGWVIVDLALSDRPWSSVWTTHDGGRTWSASSPLPG
jgi:hypothetical protein